MLSIWSIAYVTYKKCTPFQAVKREPFVLTKTPTSTFGQTKVLSTSKVFDKKTISSVILNAKRKFDETNLDDDLCSKQSEKKLAGIDHELSQYANYSRDRKSFCSLPTSSSSSSSSSSDQSQETESQYFSSSNKSKFSIKSPILNRVTFNVIIYVIVWLHRMEI